MASAHEYRSTASDTRVAGRAVEAEVPWGEGQPRAAGAEMAAGEDGENARHRPPDRSRSRAAAAAAVAVAVAVAPRGRTRPVMAREGGGDEGKGRGGGRGEKREGEGTGRTQVGLGWVPERARESGRNVEGRPGRVLPMSGGVCQRRPRVKEGGGTMGSNSPRY